MAWVDTYDTLAVEDFITGQTHIAGASNKTGFDVSLSKSTIEIYLVHFRACKKVLSPLLKWSVLEQY